MDVVADKRFVDEVDDERLMNVIVDKRFVDEVNEEWISRRFRSAHEFDLVVRCSSSEMIHWQLLVFLFVVNEFTCRLFLGKLPTFDFCQ